MWMNLISTMCLRIRTVINVGEGAGGYEMQNAQTVVRMGEGGRVINPVLWPKNRWGCYTSSGTGTVTPYMTKCSQSFHDRNNIAIRALFNGLALEYLYKHLVSPFFEDQFNVSGHSGMKKTVRDAFQKITRLAPTDKTYMNYNRLFKNEKFVSYDIGLDNFVSHTERGESANEITETKGSIGWLRKIRVLEESARGQADDTDYEDGVLIFPVRYCFNVTFPVKGNEGIILRLRVGGMVKQRGHENVHKF